MEPPESEDSSGSKAIYRLLLGRHATLRLAFVTLSASTQVTGSGGRFGVRATVAAALALPTHPWRSNG